MLERLNAVNDVAITSVFDDSFKTYGNVIKDKDFSELIHYMEEHTDIPENGNVYVASDSEMEKYPVVKDIKEIFYGDMPIQVGYCNGRNTTYNGFEYHKGSEINVAITDFMLVLGHTWEIAEDNTYKVEDAKVFFVPKGTAIEMFQTTLHLSPVRVNDEGFKGIVILPRATNTPLDRKPKAESGEERLLLQRNKWVIAHPEREPLIKQGAFPGLLGENKELHY
ncbi:protein of unknown function [Pseudobutyrivibrio sp. YE44]|uniref:DUF4867 family protein n=1 Tax=Pseudobutyrivibrio sp. YE44 TaxID=1520802 RepID=UPI00087F8B34|nr:DUF4867 family protein [Pseudobutyrivibrio sp. YE44]SDB53494.1 protein of unknown function [Pseudobutyrivibrio sp. YE44]